MKRLLFFMLFMANVMVVWSADGDVLTAYSTEGVTIRFQVISEQDKRCQVGVDTGPTSTQTAVSPTTSGSITIPSSVRGYYVAQINNSAFSNCSSITSITIRPGILSIDESAFFGCSSLSSITFEGGVGSIGEDAFYECSSLTSITLPENVESMGEYAFSGCSSLTSIRIPKSVTSIGDGAFSNCSGLTSIVVESGNKVSPCGDKFLKACIPQ